VGLDRSTVLEALCKCSPCTFEELVETLGLEGDKRPLRRIIADLVREGLVRKKPNYEKGKLEYEASPGACG